MHVCVRVCVERESTCKLTHVCMCVYIYQSAKGAAAKGGAAQGVGAKGAAAKSGAAAKKALEALEAPPKKAAPTPAELEEQQYRLEKGTEPLATDPWAAHRSPYGGSLSPGTPPNYIPLASAMRKRGEGSEISQGMCAPYNPACMVC